MKKLLLLTAIVLLHFFTLAQTIDLPPFIRCRDEVSGLIKSPNPEAVVRNDIDGKRFIVKLPADSIFLDKILLPGLYNVSVDGSNNYFFAFSCRDHKVRSSAFLLTAIPNPCDATPTCYTGVLDTLSAEFASRDTAFTSRVDTAGFELKSFAQPGETIKLAFFFDMENGSIAVIADDTVKYKLPARNAVISMVEIFLQQLFKRLRARPEDVALNQAMVALLKAAVESALPAAPGAPDGGAIDKLPNFKYAPFAVDDLLSAYTRRRVEGPMQAVALKFEPRYSGQMVLVMSISVPKPK